MQARTPVHSALGRRLAHAADDRGRGGGRDLGSGQRRAASRCARCATTRAAARLSEAEAIHRSLLPLFKALFIESNPGPVKFLLAAMGLIENELRLPLVPVEPATGKTILEAAQASGITLREPASDARMTGLVLIGARGPHGLGRGRRPGRRRWPGAPGVPIP